VVALSCTQGVPQKQAIELCARLERHALPPETVLCRRGEPANWVWLLQHGTIRVGVLAAL
jgi:hypothetical protein